MSILHEITEKIKSFELETGLKPNVLFVNQSSKGKLERVLNFGIGIIVYYPDIFNLKIMCSDQFDGFSVGVISR